MKTTYLNTKSTKLQENIDLEYHTVELIEKKLQEANIDPGKMELILKMIKKDYRNAIVQNIRNQALEKADSLTYWLKQLR